MKTPLTPRFFRGAAILMIWPAWLQAHPGHSHGLGLTDGLLHPDAGFDFVPVVVAIGLWALLLGGRACWARFLGFIGARVSAALKSQFPTP
jgi:urease accessory protein